MKRLSGMSMLGLFCSATLAGSLWAQPSAGGGDSYHLNDRRLSIPITLPANLRKDIAKLTLYVSTDQGKTWRQEATAGPSDVSFQFDAPQDGAYWFNVSYTDKNGQSSPRDAEIYNGPPQLKVVVDTRPPAITLEVIERNGNLVTLHWDVKDDHLDATKVRLEYKAEGETEWRALDLGSNISSGKKRFTIGASGAAAFRLTAQDLAENQSAKQADSPTATPPTVSTEGADATLSGNPVNNDAAKPAQGKTASMVGEPPTLTAPPLASSPTSLGGPAAPPVAPNLPAASADSFRPAAPPAASAPPAHLPAHPPAQPAIGVSEGAGPKVIASSQPLGAAPAAGYPASPRSYGGGPIVYTNQTRLELDYEIPKAGPSGIGVIELWLTQDNGRTWKRVSEKTDPQPPYVFEAPGEGVYGFIMIVKSKAGLGRRDPSPGEAPELRVEIDTTPPLATLYPVEADPRRKDMLFLIWKAEDRNLGANPIGLFWSEEPGGPWTPIGVDLPNAGGLVPGLGRYAWRMPENLPFRIYLRLEARDLAGNVSIAETPEPVLVDLTEPEVKIKGLLPAQRKSD